MPALNSATSSRPTGRRSSDRVSVSGTRASSPRYTRCRSRLFTGPAEDPGHAQHAALRLTDGLANAIRGRVEIAARGHGTHDLGAFFNPVKH